MSQHAAPHVDPPAGRPVVQFAYMVDDLEQAARMWAAKVGAGPFFLTRDMSLPDFRDGNGRPSELAMSTAMGQWGAVQVELIELSGASRDVPASTLTKRGLHHVAWYHPAGVDESRRLADLGWPLVATWGGPDLQFSFNDATADLGCMVEHFPVCAPIEEHFAKIAEAARGWDGSDPVRDAA